MQIGFWFSASAELPDRAQYPLNELAVSLKPLAENSNNGFEGPSHGMGEGPSLSICGFPRCASSLPITLSEAWDCGNAYNSTAAAISHLSRTTEGDHTHTLVHEEVGQLSPASWPQL